MAHAYDNNKATLARARNAAGRDLPITVPGGATLLICAITVDALVARTGGAPTCGSGSYTFTQADQNRYYASTGETISELWYLLNPPSGSVTIHIPDDNNKYFSADAASFTAGTGSYSVLRGTNGTSNESTNPTCPGITNCVAGDVAIATSGDGAITYAPSARTGTSLYEVDDGGYGHATQYYIATGSGTITMSWTFDTSSTWGAVVAVFQEWPQNMTIGSGGTLSQSTAVTEVKTVSVADQTTLSPSISQSFKLTEILGVSVAAPVVENLSIQVSQAAKSTDYTPTPLFQIIGIFDNASASISIQPVLEISDADTVKATEVEDASLSTPIILESSISQSAKATEAVGVDSGIIDLTASINDNAKISEIQEVIISNLNINSSEFAHIVDYISQPVYQAIGLSDSLQVQIEAGINDILIPAPVSSIKMTEALELLVSSPVDLSVQNAQSAELTEASESAVSSQVDLSAQTVQSAKLTEALESAVSSQVDLSAQTVQSAKLTETLESAVSSQVGLSAQIAQSAKLTEALESAVSSQVGLSAQTVQSAKLTEALESAVSSQVDFSVQSTQSAKLIEAIGINSPIIDLIPSISESVKFFESQEINLEGIVYDLNVNNSDFAHAIDYISQPLYQAIGLSDSLQVQIEAGVNDILITSPVNSAKLTEALELTVSSQVDLSAQANEVARASDNAAMAISDQPTLSAGATDIVRIIRVQTTNVEGLLADLNMVDTETIRVLDYPGVIVETPITLSPAASQAANLTEDRTVSISAQQDQNISLAAVARATETIAASVSDQTAIAPSISQSFKAIEDKTVTVASQIFINASIADSAQIAEVLMAETEEFPAIEITSPAETIRATESRTVSLLAQLAIELAAIDSVTVIDIPNGAKQEATPLTPQATESVLTSELLAGETSAPITLNSEITDHIRATDRITALVRSLVSIIDIEVDVRINQPGILSSTGNCAVPIIRNIPSINIMGGNFGIISMISGIHHIKIEDIESIGATEMIAAEVI